MHCPYCQQSVAEESVQCEACGLDLARLDTVLGIAPVIPAGLSDRAGMLGRRGTWQVKRAIRQFRDRFPQIQLAVVVGVGPVSVPLRTWAWWLFNRGNFSAALDKGFVNRDLLLALDPLRRQLALTIGYGLEPFVGQRELAVALAAGQAAVESGEWADACTGVLVALDHGLRTIVGRMPQAYGVPLPVLLEEYEPVAEAKVAW